MIYFIYSVCICACIFRFIYVYTLTKKTMWLKYVHALSLPVRKKCYTSIDGLRSWPLIGHSYVLNYHHRPISSSSSTTRGPLI